MADDKAQSNYARYRAAPFNRPEHYAPGRRPDPARYRPVGPWVGRLITPATAERAAVLGAWLELWHTPDAHRALAGTRVRLRWEDTPDLNARLWGATRHVIFSDEAHKAAGEGYVLPERLNGMANVNPFESLAAAHPYDDMLVRLDGPVRVDHEPFDGREPVLYVSAVPAEVSAPYYALVYFEGPAGDGAGYQARHYSAATRDFSGPAEVVVLPEVVPDGNGNRNATAAGIERSPCNEQGWYIYGALDDEGRFVVRALAARQLLRLAPGEVVAGTAAAMAYLRPKAWRKAAAKGAATQALLVPDGVDPEAARAGWGVGDSALLIHLYGGIGGERAEAAARSPLYWGHFSFGVATVVHEPLADEPRFDIVYHQIYAHNSDGVTAGATHYSAYAGDRQRGWAGARPIQDLLVKIDAICGPFSVFGQTLTTLDQIVRQLEVMEARYRIADGQGATSVGALNNCAQDSAQALYAAVRTTSRILTARPDLRAEMSDTPEEAARLAQLARLGDELQRVLLPWGSARADWQYGTAVLGSSATGLVGSVGKAVKSWRTMLPPVAARALAEVFLAHGATIYALRTYQVGGDDPMIAPVVPNV